MSELGSPRRVVGGFVALAAVFIAGVVGGAAIDRWYLLREPGVLVGSEWTERSGRRSEPSAEVRRAMETGIPIAMLRLGLTPDQEARLTEIARRRRPIADSVMRTLRPVVSGLETQMMQEMLCALSPPQQRHWLAYMDSAHVVEAPVAAERYRLVRDHTCDHVGR